QRVEVDAALPLSVPFPLLFPLLFSPLDQHPDEARAGTDQLDVVQAEARRGDHGSEHGRDGVDLVAHVLTSVGSVPGTGKKKRGLAPTSSRPTCGSRRRSYGKSIPDRLVP